MCAASRRLAASHHDYIKLHRKDMLPTSAPPRQAPTTSAPLRQAPAAACPPLPPSQRIAVVRAAITGLCSGAARAVTSWLLTHITDSHGPG
ncbi:hypothetical protein SMC26_22555 [Actinomadura fulvescens]|uniref:Uncharacterized protein n=1 Tax=Actinomadura fulvescens TaxID=46160 RepID=A0ABN3QP53_9ACTN